MNLAAAFRAAGASCLPDGIVVGLIDHPDGTELRLQLTLNSSTKVPGPDAASLADLVPLLEKAVRGLRTYAASEECWRGEP